jgi:hypothetical protein
LHESDISVIDGWLRTIADREMLVRYNDERDINNWNSHRINIIGQIGFLIGDNKYVDYSTEEYKKQIQNNLYPDGSSLDFELRDALHYHSYNIWPLLNLAKTAQLNGIDLYNYQAPSGASLPKSLHYLYPYFSGQLTHKEFVNSKVEWDTKSGSKKLTAAEAKNWIPSKDLYILELAYFFEDDPLPIIQTIRNNKVEFPSFETMLARTQRDEIPVMILPIQDIN